MRSAAPRPRARTRIAAVTVILRRERGRPPLEHRALGYGRRGAWRRCRHLQGVRAANGRCDDESAAGAAHARPGRSFRRPERIAASLRAMPIDREAGIICCRRRIFPMVLIRVGRQFAGYYNCGSPYVAVVSLRRLLSRHPIHQDLEPCREGEWMWEVRAVAVCLAPYTKRITGPDVSALDKPTKWRPGTDAWKAVFSTGKPAVTRSLHTAPGREMAADGDGLDSRLPR